MESDQTRAGYVALIGRPNVGKSSLLNALMDQKIAAVSAKPQTTRRRQLGILSTEYAQMVFVDTPGIHLPQHKLGDYMNQAALDTLSDADILLWLLDASNPFTNEDKLIAEKLGGLKKRPLTWILLTKCDLVKEGELDQVRKAALDLFPAEDMLEISAVTKRGVADLRTRLIDHIPQGEFFYDPETITDAFERDISAELIRESVLQFIHDEVPHCVAVKIDSYEDRPDDRAYIAATLYVERDSQKGILVGKGGEMIKKIGTRSRQEIEAMTGRKVFLDLKVQVSKNWRNSADALSLLGYSSSRD